jgi:hypothetical protein
MTKKLVKFTTFGSSEALESWQRTNPKNNIFTAVPIMDQELGLILFVTYEDGETYEA